jgi:integrase
MSSSHAAALVSTGTWQMPIIPENYDRTPLTNEELQALEFCITCDPSKTGSREYIAAKRRLTRLDQPITDVYSLRHGDRHPTVRNSAQLLIRREMHRLGKVFWDWPPAVWMDMLCPTFVLFRMKHGNRHQSRSTIMDAAYLLGGVTDLRPLGHGLNLAEAAQVYFGSELISQQYRRVIDVLIEKGFIDGIGNRLTLQQCLSLLFILNRSPHLEDISEELMDITRSDDRIQVRQASKRIGIALRALNILPPEPAKEYVVPLKADSSGMASEWYAWCMAWFAHAVDLTPRVRANYAGKILMIGRWLHECVPEVRTPEQWTEDLALRFRSEVCSWKAGQYASARWLELRTGRRYELPTKAGTISPLISALKRFLSDLTKHPYAVGGEPARKIRLDFSPGEVLTCPAPVKKELEAVEPRDIDFRTWARLVIAAATLARSDLPNNPRYPLSFYRALALAWVSTARRPNEIARLRLDCVRDDWDPGMLDEYNQLLQIPTMANTSTRQSPGIPKENSPKIYYLHIPSGKNRGPFWIWIPDYVADAIDAWKRERPKNLRKIFDRKDREEVDYLFCSKDSRVGEKYINNSLIPVLCKKAGVDIEDTKGRITGHRARSTRLTLLRINGVSLEDLAEYAGHADTRTLRKHYVRHRSDQFHRIIKDADDISRIIEGVVDIQAAAQGLPALRWFIGYDADGEPQYCANQVYHTCPHRLDCAKCGMFIGGEKAKLLHEGGQTLPIESKVPMTPIEKCLVDGDQKGVEACQATLQQIPAPKTPDMRLIFNPEGLSNQELEQLAQIATVDALEKLRQALDAHEKRLEDIQQHKTGRSALVGAQKKRISLIQTLIIECEQRVRQLPPGGSSAQTQ